MKIQRQLLAITVLVAMLALVSFFRLVSAQRGKAFVSHTADANAQATDTFSPKDHVIYCIVEVMGASTGVVWGSIQ